MPSFKVNRDAIEVCGDTPEELTAATAEALRALGHIRATPPTQERPAAGFRLDSERRATSTVQPTAQQAYWRGRPPAPATAHTEEQP